MAKPAITSLAPEHHALLRQYRDRWNAIERSTEPVDKERSESCLRQAYRLGLLGEVPIIWCSSPTAIEIVKKVQTDNSLSQKTDWSLINRKLDQEFGFEASEKIASTVQESLKRCIGTRVGNAAINEVWEKAWEYTGANVRAVIDRAARSKAVVIGEGMNVWPQIVSSLFAGNVETTQWWRNRASIAPSISRAGYPLPHFITYEFYRDVLKLFNETNLIKPLLEQMKAASYFTPFRGICFASERPSKIGVDGRGRLHSDDSAALEYADGVRTFAIHGVAVSRKMIEAWETVTAKDIDKEQNTEVRRVMTEKYGFARYIMETGAKLVHSDRYGELYKKERKRWEEPIVMVKVRNSTPEPDGSIKDYFLRVRWDVRTAHEGVASTFGKTAAEYNPIKET